MMTDPRIVAVVVTYNRRELLLECLAALQAQTHRVDEVVVVDNASMDGTAAAVRAQFPDTTLFELTCNTGGAGGFAVGLAAALERGADLVWLMDDDTIPTTRALAALVAARRSYVGRPPTVIASRVEWMDGRDHPMNTPRAKLLAGRRERSAAATARCVPIRSASFVSVLLDADVCRDRGLPVADYFLWNDDFEYTTRLLRGRVGLLCPASVVVHKTHRAGGTDVDPGARFYFEVRNKVWLLTRSRCFAWHERPLYAASTVRRWVRTVLRSRSRGDLVRQLVRGLRDGFVRGPRDNADVLPHMPAARRAAVTT
jgi:rhamnopyranosyl-N-acetylglucosaminyl-diphospho-decaprenol beta-1,3/1,4-galactofuranosyltransferase